MPRASGTSDSVAERRHRAHGIRITMKPMVTQAMPVATMPGRDDPRWKLRTAPATPPSSPLPIHRAAASRPTSSVVSVPDSTLSP